MIRTSTVKEARRFLEVVLVFLLIAAFGAATIAHAQEWRGIVPLQSNRGDAETILGRSVREYPPYAEYRLGPELIEIEYARSAEVERICGIRIPDGTVLSVRRILERPIPEAFIRRQFKGLKRFRVRNGADEPFGGYRILFDEHRGIAAQVLDGEVEWIQYFAPLNSRGRYAALYSSDPQDYFRPPIVGHIYVQCVVGTDATEVTVGESVKFSVRILNKGYQEPLSYSYYVTGGRIEGSSDSAVWDTRGLAPGSYDIVAIVRDGVGNNQECGTTVLLRPMPAPR